MSKEREIAVIAHRGAKQLAPENTIPAFRAAIEIGVDCAEIDIQTTADGELVVIHNSTVDDRTNGTGAVRDMSLAEIRKLDAGSWFDPAFSGTVIPTADEAMGFMDGKIDVYLDAKGAGPEQIVELIARHDMFASTIVYHEASAHQAMHRLEPAVRAMLPRPPSDLSELPAIAEHVRPSTFGTSSREIDLATCDACHEVGAEVFVNVMGADDPDGWQHAIDCGADALETDKPVEMLDFLRSRGMHE